VSTYYIFTQFNNDDYYYYYLELLKCAELCTQPHTRTHIHDGHFVQTKQSKTTVLYTSTYLHDPSLATCYIIHVRYVHMGVAPLSTKLASSLSIWQAITFLTFLLGIMFTLSHNITAKQMIASFTLEVYSSISQPPTMLLFLLKLGTFPEPLRKITCLYTPYYVHFCDLTESVQINYHSHSTAQWTKYSCFCIYFYPTAKRYIVHSLLYKKMSIYMIESLERTK
jgi:hypothetical protein